MALKISGESFEEQVLGSEKPVIVDFYSDSCVPCKRMSPVLSAVEAEYGDKVRVVKINVNFDGETAEKYNVTSVPTLLFFKDGEVTDIINGAVKKERIVEIIDKL